MRQIRERYPKVPFFALTATATDRVREDIIAQLALRQPTIHIASFNRPNLYYEVRQKPKQSYEALRQKVVTLLRQSKGSGIIYCLSRKRVDQITEKLQNDGIPAVPYHAGLSDDERRENQTRFIRDDVRLIVATVAFGMGINKPDVRFVLHYDIPRSLENYYQEAGRAGRDGEPAQCMLFFGLGDIKTIEYLIAQKIHPITQEPLEDEQRIARQQLRQVIDYAEGTDCRRKIQLGYFNESAPDYCGNCDNCLNPKPKQDWTIEAQKFLSCVARTKERFGINHIIDVLRGSQNKRVLQHNHHTLSTYGIGKDHSAEAWRSLARSLLHQGLVSETTDGYSVLQLNPLSWEVMRKQRSVIIALTIDSPRLARSSHNKHELLQSITQQEERLMECLRKLRKTIADEQNVPPYVVFADASLRAMSVAQPQTLAEFAAIPGVGSRKLERYGITFIKEIQAFLAKS